MPPLKKLFPSNLPIHCRVAALFVDEPIELYFGNHTLLEICLVYTPNTRGKALDSIDAGMVKDRLSPCAYAVSSNVRSWYRC